MSRTINITETDKQIKENTTRNGNHFAITAEANMFAY